MNDQKQQGQFETQQFSQEDLRHLHTLCQSWVRTNKRERPWRQESIKRVKELEHRVCKYIDLDY